MFSTAVFLHMMGEKQDFTLPHSFENAVQAVEYQEIHLPHRLGHLPFDRHSKAAAATALAPEPKLVTDQWAGVLHCC